MDREVTLHNNFTVHTDLLIDEVGSTDLIFIPAFTGKAAEALEINREFIPWIREQQKKGAEVVSLCVGAFILAKTGLLDDKQCSTHWRAAQEFREMFPHIELVTDKIITEQDGVYTSGGATSYYNLLIYLVEKCTDRETAIRTAKVFAIDFDRETQNQFIIFKGQTNHSDEHIRKAQQFIEDNFQDRITIDKLSQRFALSRRSLERRFKRATNNTVNEYISVSRSKPPRRVLKQAEEYFRSDVWSAIPIPKLFAAHLKTNRDDAS